MNESNGGQVGFDSCDQVAISDFFAHVVSPVVVFDCLGDTLSHI